MEEDERAGNVACKEEMRNLYKIAVGETFGRFRYIWEDNTKMQLGYEGGNSIKLVQNMVRW
jgi:hypothetical protein